MEIRSFLPNPAGSDKEGELFSIFNDSESAANLSGWYVKDEAGRSFWLFGQIEANQEISFPLKGSSLTLNNDGETLYLYNPAGSLIDELSYIGKAGEDQIIKKEIEITEEIRNELFESYALEPLQANILSSSAQSPVFLSIIFALILAGLTVFLVNKIPKSEEEELLGEFANESSKPSAEEWIS
ncbi:MAG: lamin tail domain-containing protein [bacterium]|nr:lamin tail domain-containing protein [bacterium]